LNLGILGMFLTRKPILSYPSPSPSPSLATTMVDKTVKGLEPLNQTFEGASNLRIGIVHARWNDSVIKALVDGTVDALKKQGVKKENIVIKTVPGSYELPFACQK
jgi:6,7-dimethyl-8-ribityllumazine synthase